MSTVRDVVKSFDNSAALGQAEKEAVEALAALGDAKAEIFTLDIEKSLLTAGNGSNLTVPVTAIIGSISRVRAFTSTEADNIANVVQGALTNFLQGTAGGIVSGITTLISGTLSTFLGEASASTGTIKEYYVATEGLAAIRVDMRAWYINVTATSILKKTERVTAVVATKSVVNLAKVDFATFLVLYQRQLSAGGATPEELKNALAQAQEIYDAFKKVESQNGPAPAANQSLLQIDDERGYFDDTPPAVHGIARQNKFKAKQADE